MGYNLLINGVYWGYNPLILTFYQHFQRDIQVGDGIIDRYNLDLPIYSRFRSLDFYIIVGNPNLNLHLRLLLGEGPRYTVVTIIHVAPFSTSYVGGTFPRKKRLFATGILGGRFFSPRYLTA